MSTSRTTENYFIVRADNTFSDKDRIFATVMFDKASQTLPDEFNNKLYHNPTRRNVVSIEENHTFTPQLLNSARFGLNVDNVQSPSGATPINKLHHRYFSRFYSRRIGRQRKHRSVYYFLWGISTAQPFSVRLPFVAGLRQPLLYQGDFIP